MANMDQSTTYATPRLPNIHEQRLPAPLAQGQRPPWADSLNVGTGERIASGAVGSALALLGLGRSGLSGLLLAGVGGALIHRGVTGHCYAYNALGVDTADEEAKSRRAGRGIHVTQSFLIAKPPEELYSWWRNFENLPCIMTHLESVRVLDDGRSHWVAKAPAVAGGSVEWDAEITAEEPGARIAWRSLPDSDVEHLGEVRFSSALGDRGTAVHVVLDYSPPAGQIGTWTAKLFGELFGEKPEQQIRDDLRNFKRLMEVGQILTVSGQPHGTCGVRTGHFAP